MTSDLPSSSHSHARALPGSFAGQESTSVAIDRGAVFSEELEKDRQHREKAKSLKPLRRLAPFILAYPGLLAAFTVFLVLASVLTLALPAAFRLVVDCGFSGALEADTCRYVTQASDENGPALGWFFLLGMAVAGGLGVVSALRYYFISRLGERVVADLRSTVYNHLLGLSPAFFAKVRTGEVLSRLTTDTTLIQTLVGSSISVALRTVATTIGALTMMIVVNWKLSLLVLLLGPVIIGPIMLFGRRVQRLSRSSQDSLANASARASESLMAIETVQAFTREKFERSAFGKAVEETYAIAMRRIRVRTMMTALIFTIVLSGLIAVLWYGASLVQAGVMTPGSMTQFVMYAFFSVSGVGMLTETYTEVMRAAGATERLMELLAADAEIAVPDNPKILPSDGKGEIIFDGVTFAYPARSEVKALESFSCAIKPGETIALVGPSGAGKSTVFQLLMRFYDPQAGTIKVDGLDIRQTDPVHLRQIFAVVQQNAPLFSGNVYDNILYGREGAERKHAHDAAIAANADEFIRKLPEGYETQLGEGAAQLSGGQRQRLSIARAIIRQAPVLLLDEATSALDSESEQAVQQAFKTASQGRTTLVIAHRLSTVLHADRIFVMEDGNIVDIGDHESLLSRGGLYARLARLQFGGDALSGKAAAE